MKPTARRWLSVHVFLADPALQERYLCEHVKPRLREWRSTGRVSQWFFIRYWEGGPHLRIRLAGDVANDPASVIEALRAGIGAWQSASPPQRDSYYRGHAFDGVPVDVAALPWYPEGSVELIEYVPETQRYGGPQALAASESLFELSSELALSVCRSAPQGLTARLSVAYSLMAASALATVPAIVGVGAFFRNYAAYWSQHSAQTRALAAQLAERPSEATAEQLAVLRRLAQSRGDERSERNAVGTWAAGVRKLVTELKILSLAGDLHAPFGGARAVDEPACERAVQSIVGSQIHMLNNRLGVVPVAELLLATTLARAARPAERPSFAAAEAR